MIAEDLEKDHEVHHFIDHDFPRLRDNLVLKQQFHYIYIKYNDQVSTNKLFQQLLTIQRTQIETRQDQKRDSLNSDQLNRIKIKIK